MRAGPGRPPASWLPCSQTSRQSYCRPESNLPTGRQLQALCRFYFQHLAPTPASFLPSPASFLMLSPLSAVSSQNPVHHLTTLSDCSRAWPNTALQRNRPPQYHCLCAITTLSSYGYCLPLPCQGSGRLSAFAFIISAKAYGVAPRKKTSPAAVGTHHRMNTFGLIR